jgi:hypothetical protein
LAKRQPTLAKKITDSFPDPKVVLAYVNPITSWSDGGSGPNFNFSELRPPAPVIEDLAAFCQKKFSWGMDKVLAKFENLLWSGACLAMLVEVCALNSFRICAVITSFLDCRFGPYSGPRRRPRLCHSQAKAVSTAKSESRALQATIPALWFCLSCSPRNGTKTACP